MIRYLLCLSVVLLSAYHACGQYSPYDPVIPVRPQNVRDTMFCMGVSPFVVLEQQLLYDKYTLEDEYPYYNTTRRFQWDKIKASLRLVDSLQSEPVRWGVLQNYKNRNGVAAIVYGYRKDEYDRIADRYGVERYQSTPLFTPGDHSRPHRYARDGSLVKIVESVGEDSVLVEMVFYGSLWTVPARYLKELGENGHFTKAIFVDRRNQNITTIEKEGWKWLVRSKNPATTGLKNPPYQMQTPLGIYVVQERKTRMQFLVDGSTEMGGYAPFANRFSSGAYIHGVPVNLPDTARIEYSWSLGTSPRSHMCVRNATSHSEYIFNWQVTGGTLVFVLE